MCLYISTHVGQVIKWELSGTVGRMQQLQCLETNRRYCVDQRALVHYYFVWEIAGNSEVNISVPLTRNFLALQQLLPCHHIYVQSPFSGSVLSTSKEQHDGDVWYLFP